MTLALLCTMTFYGHDRSPYEIYFDETLSSMQTYKTTSEFTPLYHNYNFGYEAINYSATSLLRSSSYVEGSGCDWCPGTLYANVDGDLVCDVCSRNYGTAGDPLNSDPLPISSGMPALVLLACLYAAFILLKRKLNSYLLPLHS